MSYNHISILSTHYRYITIVTAFFAIQEEYLKSIGRVGKKYKKKMQAAVYIPLYFTRHLDAHRVEMWKTKVPSKNILFFEVSDRNHDYFVIMGSPYEKLI